MSKVIYLGLTQAELDELWPDIVAYLEENYSLIIKNTGGGGMQLSSTIEQFNEAVAYAKEIRGVLDVKEDATQDEKGLEETNHCDIGQKHPSLIDMINGIENGRFSNLTDAIQFSDTCLKCSLFDLSQKDHYRCACLGKCPGVTLSYDTNSYLLKKIKTVYSL